jgi:alpha-galactosidase
MKAPKFIYSFSGNPTERELFPNFPDGKPDDWHENFDADKQEMNLSGEYAIPIAEAIFFDKPTEIGATNMPNKGYAPNLPEGMVIELPAFVDGKGIHPKKTDPLPDAIASMICTQGAIHRLVIDACIEGSKNKLLQAVLLDPTVSSYHNAVAMIDEMCERQKELLPKMKW